MTTTAPRAAPRLPGRPHPVGPARQGRVVPVLARFEARKLLLHPAFLVGVALTVLVIRTAAGGRILPSADGEVGVGLAPLGWATIIAANLCALRSRRHRTEELLGSLPTAPRIRTLGLLLSCLATAGAAAALVAGWLLLELVRGPIGSPNLVELTTGPLLVAGGAALGVAAARWVPTVLLGPVLVVATMVGQTSLNYSDLSPARWLAFWVGHAAPDIPAGQDGSPFPSLVHWHALYLGALVGVAGVVAIARHGFDRAVAASLAVAVGLVGVAGWAQTRPVSGAEARRLAAALTARADVCETRAGVRYCVADAIYRRRIDQWAGPVEAVLRRVPGPVRQRGLVVSQGELNVVSNRHCNPTPLLELQFPAVRALVTAERLWPADGAVRPGRAWPWEPECNLTDHGLVLTLQVGAWAVGLPPAQSSAPPCRAGGQARSVLALWLGAQASPGAPGALAEVLEQYRLVRLGAAPAYAWATWPNWGVAWDDRDMAMALRVLERPAVEVEKVVRDNWDRLVSPATPASLFATLAGVPLPDQQSPLFADGPVCP